MQRPSRSPKSSPQNTPPSTPPRRSVSPPLWRRPSNRWDPSTIVIAVLVAGFVVGLGILAAEFSQVTAAAKTPTIQTQSQPAFLWEEEDDSSIVHVIETRFMQYQPDLVELGKARVELLETVTLPSIRAQTLPFLWVVRTDPDLHPDLREPLVRLLEQVPNAVLIASTENPEGVRNGAVAINVTQSDLWVGQLETLKSFIEAAQTHTIINTRLDADDALERNFCTNVREAVTRHHPTRTIQVWCVANHLEYQHYSLWHDNDRGALVGMRTNWCVTAGLSWAFAPGIHDDAPRVPHHDAIHHYYPECEGGHKKKHKDKHHNKPGDPCVGRLYTDAVPGALRARTPTSAGMLNMILAVGDDNGSKTTSKATTMRKGALHKLQKSKWKNVQEAIWASLPAVFGLVPQRFWDLRRHLEANMVPLLQDAIRGQCTQGHSCKNQSQIALETLLEAYRIREQPPQHAG